MKNLFEGGIISDIAQELTQGLNNQIWVITEYE